MSLKALLALGTGLLFLALCVAQAAVLHHQSAKAMQDAALSRQAVSLRIVIDRFRSAFEGIEVAAAADGTVQRVTWDRLPEIGDHDVIDRAGAISGETATLFAWEAARGEFVRITTNIRKDDGTRAVGTVLGRDNPVHAAMLRGERYTGQAQILGKPYLTLYQPILAPTGEVLGIFYVGIDRSRIDSAIAAQRWASLLVSGLLIVLGVALLLAMLNVLFRPLPALGRAFERMAGDDLDTEVPHTGRRDEIGAIARSADAFRAKLASARVLDAQARQRQQETVEIVEILRTGLERLAAGDLTHALETPFPDEYEGLRADFNSTIETLNELIASLVENATEIRTRAGEIGSASGELSQRTENQAATLEETAAALDELTSSVRAAADGAAEVERVVSAARGDAEASGRVVSDAIGAMSEIKRSSDEIGQIIGVIDDIAFQTNLLALNAGVEAARAGEAGRGFAVVASEVRALAQRSSDAAKEIKTLIGTSSDQVESGVALVNRAGEALSDIVGRVANIADLVSGIATGAQEQSVGLGEINVGVTQLDQVTQQNAAMVEEATAASATLRHEAETLEQMVSRFRVRRSTGTAMRAVPDRSGPPGAARVSGTRDEPAFARHGGRAVRYL
nr:methyl-accepting chemotaxis protein [Rhodovulum strictum]